MPIWQLFTVAAVVPAGPRQSGELQPVALVAQEGAADVEEPGVLVEDVRDEAGRGWLQLCEPLEAFARRQREHLGRLSLRDRSLRGQPDA